MPGRSALRLLAPPDGYRPDDRHHQQRRGQLEGHQQRSQQHPADRGDPAQAGLALMWMAVVRQAERNLDQAELLYQNALAVQDPKSTEAATILKVYAHFVRREGRPEEASKLDARAMAVQKANAKPAPAVKVKPLSSKPLRWQWNWVSA